MQDYNLKKANVFVIGKTGVGKTTLVNNLFLSEVGKVAVGDSQTKGIQKYAVSGFPLTLYDVQGFDLENTQGIMKAIQDKITEEQLTLKQEEIIHAIFYCVSHCAERFLRAEGDFIKQLSWQYKVPVFIVFTKAFMFDQQNPEEDEYIKYVKTLHLPIVGCFPVVCEKFPNTTTGEFGLQELTDKLWEVLPVHIANMVAAAKMTHLQVKHDKAVNWIWAYAAGNFALGAVIPPGADIAYLTLVEGVMAKHITSILYEGTDKGAIGIISEALASCAGPLLGTLVGTIAFNEVIKVGSLFLAPVTLGGSVLAAAVAGGLVAAGITIALGRTYLWITEEMLAGKIDKEKIKQKDPVLMNEFKEQFKSNYKDAREKMKNDERFTKKSFQSKKY